MSARPDDGNAGGTAGVESPLVPIRTRFLFNESFSDMILNQDQFHLYPILILPSNDNYQETWFGKSKPFPSNLII